MNPYLAKSCDWAHTNRLLLLNICADFIISVVFLSLGGILSLRLIMEHFINHREFSLTDESIGYTMEASIVPSLVVILFLVLGMLAVPLLIAVTQSRRLAVLYLFIGALCASMMFLIVSFIKVVAARLRPDFIDRCQWDAAAEKCTGPASIVFDGRLSFPSGHASFSMFLSLYVSIVCVLTFIVRGEVWKYPKLMQLRALVSPAGWFALSTLPMFFGSFVGVSRTVDHHHHSTDVIGGFIIGSFFAVLTVVLAEFHYTKDARIKAIMEADVLGGGQMLSKGTSMPQLPQLHKGISAASKAILSAVSSVSELTPRHHASHELNGSPPLRTVAIDTHHSPDGDMV
ncbi:PAP2 superfamily [Carpediemonas membranifera]|uniref:PAP2 superfamily n=1 Tax=Carpediemonas membranifera TaxID=201153 RepID=A0A8J6B645_9EUKA|nr:PAP2 superfamily [Carpediemonas membranifera]|eukprot:KAG9393869.1 PAP2 superfamily [Carpediemonas membranifera]